MRMTYCTDYFHFSGGKLDRRLRTEPSPSAPRCTFVGVSLRPHFHLFPACYEAEISQRLRHCIRANPGPIADRNERRRPLVVAQRPCLGIVVPPRLSPC